MIDIVCISNANFVNVYIKWFKLIKKVIVWALYLIKMSNNPSTLIFNQRDFLRETWKGYIVQLFIY